MIDPVTGWPIKYMLQREDVNLAHQRGMPAPFDNGVMRFAWISPLVTSWKGDHGRLLRLHVTIHLPVLYGDTSCYTGQVTETANEGDFSRVGIQIRGRNQRGSMTTSGRAEVLLPLSWSARYTRPVRLVAVGDVLLADVVQDRLDVRRPVVRRSFQIGRAQSRWKH